MRNTVSIGLTRNHDAPPRWYSGAAKRRTIKKRAENREEDGKAKKKGKIKDSAQFPHFS